MSQIMMGYAQQPLLLLLLLLLLIQDSVPNAQAKPSRPLRQARSWRLQSTHQGHSFFKGFSFFDSPDPTHGFVDYVDERTAMALGLIEFDDGAVVIGSGAGLGNSSHTVSTGRSSVRVQSDATFNQGLFLFDVEHMPAGCGAWPAIWMNGPDWPHGGEIDIVEGVNLQKRNIVTLHTTTGCTLPEEQYHHHHHHHHHTAATGRMLTSNCAIDAPGQKPNQGCSIEDRSRRSFGAKFNRHGGGIFALELDREHGIRSWFFERGHIPKDIAHDASILSPDRWGHHHHRDRPTAVFPFGPDCSASFFHDLRIIINLTFCGDWAGSPESYLGCPGSSCVDYVKAAPMPEAFWRIRSVKVYQ